LLGRISDFTSLCETFSPFLSMILFMAYLRLSWLFSPLLLLENLLSFIPFRWSINPFKNNHMSFYLERMHLLH
jgi:hypothetical protein